MKYSDERPLHFLSLKISHENHSHQYFISNPDNKSSMIVFRSGNIMQGTSSPSITKESARKVV
jgi:hypothetical protein